MTSPTRPTPDALAALLERVRRALQSLDGLLLRNYGPELGVVGEISAADLRALCAAVEALAADAERLDWLGNNLAYVMLAVGGVMQQLENRGIGWQENELRGALDAARSLPVTPTNGETE